MLLCTDLLREIKKYYLLFNVHRVTLKFNVRDKQNKPVLVQQAFVLVASKDSAAAAVDEAIFVAEPDNSKAYKVELVSDALGFRNNISLVQIRGSQTFILIDTFKV